MECSRASHSMRAARPIVISGYSGWCQVLLASLLLLYLSAGLRCRGQTIHRAAEEENTVGGAGQQDAGGEHTAVAAQALGDQPQPAKPHWGYEDTSAWGEHAEHCWRTGQSPIDIQSKAALRVHVSQFYPKTLLTFVNYNQGAPDANWTLRNNGHAAQVDVASELGYYIQGAGLDGLYKAAQFHFHWGEDDTHGSEHGLDGKYFPMEMHIVHHHNKFSDLGSAAPEHKGLAVLGIWIQVGNKDNDAIERLIKHMKSVTTKDAKLRVPVFPLLDLLPSNTEEYFQYYGSLTTPPCYQSVNWIVFRTPITISKRQINEFRSLTEDADGQRPLLKNFRPAQRLNQREVLATFAPQRKEVKSAVKNEVNEISAPGGGRSDKKLSFGGRPDNSGRSYWSSNIMTCAGIIISYLCWQNTNSMLVTLI